MFFIRTSLWVPSQRDQVKTLFIMQSESPGVLKYIIFIDINAYAEHPESFRHPGFWDPDTDYTN